jgi:hypothetical protein
MPMSGGKRNHEDMYQTHDGTGPSGLYGYTGDHRLITARPFAHFRHRTVVGQW